MPSLYDLKPAFQRSLRGVSRRLAQGGVTPNQITVAALLLSTAHGIAIAAAPDSAAVLLAMPATLLARMALNALDGMLAREHGMQSRLGAYLNELGDVLADCALYLPLALVPGFPAILVVATGSLGVIAELAGVCAVQIGAERRYDGPLGKSVRAFAIGLVCLLVGAGLEPGRWLQLAFLALAALSALTIVNRTRAALRAAS